ncbi:MAG TPA: response regulator [Kofleriaceae bacterium]|jgi:DNA-binding response OmpR family regulator
MTALRVLLCDDGADLRTLLADVLRERGHIVHEAATGAEAITCATEHLLDVAFIDTSLPDMSGFDVGRRLRDARLANKVRLIALADHHSTEEMATSRIAGFDMVLLKPVKLEQVIAALGLVKRLL